ncbi:MAG TPA: MFS transporter [Vicinamibacterales bacterium]|nr:MFS transporter [Vicinamibacterales bacterium]
MLRWRIAALVSAAIAISYLDRQALPVAIGAIERDIPVTNEQFSFLQSSFLVSYALMYAAGGRLMDVIGTRAGFIVIMVFWSLACASHGLASSVTMLAISRFLLGMGEGGGFPAATRAVAEWFPVHERSTAMGIVNAGTAVGGVLAPPLIALVLTRFDWPVVFYLTAAAGIAWTLWWAREYFVPAAHPRLSSSERQLLAPVLASSAAQETPPGWLTLLRIRQTWGLVTAKCLSDAAWYFYLFWLPKYLYDARGFDIKTVGALAWMPHAAAFAGCLAGGWFSSWLLTRAVSLDRARKIALGASAAVMPAVLLIPNAPIAWAIAIFCLAYLGQQSWSTLVMILPADIYPRGAVGAVAGLVGFGGAMGGIVFGQVVGYLLDHGHGYGVVFALAGSFHVIAFAVICIVIPRIVPLAPVAGAPAATSS